MSDNKATLVIPIKEIIEMVILDSINKGLLKRLPIDMYRGSCNIDEDYNFNLEIYLPDEY